MSPLGKLTTRTASAAPRLAPAPANDAPVAWECVVAPGQPWRLRGALLIVLSLGPPETGAYDARVHFHTGASALASDMCGSSDWERIADPEVGAESDEDDVDTHFFERTIVGVGRGVGR